MRVFVTGGTGLLGNTILRQLTDAGHESSALVRQPPEAAVFDGVETEFVRGDLLDQDLIETAVQDCDAVIHAAGLIHIGWQRLDESMRVNAEGTQVMVDACLRNHKKLIHIGTVNTMAVGSFERPADETTALTNGGGQVLCSYVLSKRAGVEEVKRGVAQGLKAVILCPGFMLGPWDWKPSSGRMMIALSQGWKAIAPKGGCSVCDVRDVAAATITSVEKDLPSGREFILAGENMTYKELWTEMAQRFSKPAPLMRAGPLQRWIAGVAGDAIARFTAEPDFNSAGMKMSTQFHWYDSTRAREELGYRPRPIDQSLDEAAQWLKDHHL